MSEASTARIHVLPDIVRDQIAAGEVVVRPASVVKELVENALDAGARNVRVDLEEGGAKLVRVTDDGCGMSGADLELAFEAHATSKLSAAGDLDHIATLGFRGEALASIGSVARCRIVSRETQASTGAAVECEGGRRSPVVEAGAAQGTSIEIRDLFYNTPARRRFLKRPSTELSHCLDILQRLALAHEGTGFVVTHDGKRVLDVEPEMDLRARVRRTFGRDLAEALVPVAATDGTTQISGWVAPPRFSRTDTSRQMWFLNGRAVRDKVLVRVLREGFRGFLVENRQPVAFLQLALDPAAVDVNVHPQKSEVRFRDQRRLFGFLVHALRDAVRTTDMSTPGESMLKGLQRRGAWEPSGPTLPDPGPLAPQRDGAGSGSPGRSAGSLPLPGRPREELAVHDVPGRSWNPAAGQLEVAPEASQGQTGADQGASGSAAWQADDDFRGPYLQVAKTFLVRSVEDGFEIVDQHALHERLTFEGLLCDVRAGRVEVQSLLVPELIEVSRAQVGLLEEHGESLERIGVKLAPFGPTTIAVHGLPARLRRPDTEGVVRDVLEVIERTGQAPDTEDVLEEVLHRTACRSSIMAGDELTQEEIRSLLVRARELETDQTCPHARPTRVRFTVADLERAFHRR